ncbi:MAG: polysulfide reductase NrfD [Thermoanaerobacteraceae bacterium]|nr:polysulfide reductase NrfD [Thermoanaerobacteraceae bacterium]
MAWAHLGQGGLASTKLSNDSPWGLYVVGFFYLVSIALGMLCIIAVCMLFLPNEASLIQALAYVVGFMVAAGLLIVFDLGRPLRVPAMLVGNPASLLVWDLYLCAAVVVISIGSLVARAGVGMLLAGLMFVVGVSAFMVHSKFFVEYRYAGQRADRLTYVLDGLMNGLAVILGVQLYYTGGVPEQLVLGAVVLGFARVLVELAHNAAPAELIVRVVEALLLLLYKGYPHPAVAILAILIILIHGFVSKLRAVEGFGATYPAQAIAGRPRSYIPTAHEYIVLCACIIMAICIGVALEWLA